MKTLLAFLSFSFIACSTDYQNEYASIEEISTATATPIENERTIATDSPEEMTPADSILAESFLKKFFEYGMITAEENELKLTISFNVHGPDCGAPDCYETEVVLTWPFNNEVSFPKSIPFSEHESGCVDEETYFSGTFKKIEETEDVIIYHSAENKRTLVLFSPKIEDTQHAFYFTDVSKNEITSKNAASLVELYEEDEMRLFPYRNSSLMRSFE